MEEAIRRADEAGLVIASSKRLSQALVGSGEWNGIAEAFPCWSGTMAAYGKPDQALGKTIEFSEGGIRYIFPVPENHQGKRNVILVAEHPEFTLVKDQNDWIVQATSVAAVEHFPASKKNWYLGDPEHDIPHGQALAIERRQPRSARLLFRSDRYVGLVARVAKDNENRFVYIRRYVNMSFGLGVAVEAASEAIETKSEV